MTKIEEMKKAIEYIKEWMKDEYSLNAEDREMLNIALEALRYTIIKQKEDEQMTDFTKFIELCDANGFSYHVTPVYDENNKAYPCVWLSTGHVEFDENEKIKNVVPY